MCHSCSKRKLRDFPAEKHRIRQWHAMEMRFWEDNSLQHVKFESNSNDNIPPRQGEPFYCEAANLNFATGDDDCVEYAHNGYRKTAMRVSRQDPLSHRIIEKRRRDRMNNCLADLSRLIPAEYLKKGRGRVEKTEIIEMAIKHMKHLQYMDHFRLGFQACMSEALRFLVDVEGRYAREPTCVRLLGHLQAHCDSVCRAGADATPIAVAPTVGEQIEPKVEPNNNEEQTQEDAHTANGTGFEEEAELELEVGTEKREEHHAAYKYKNDIKLRFTQDNANAQNPRRNSTPISTDNQTCSSIGSPTPGHFMDATPASLNLEATPATPTPPTPWTLTAAATPERTFANSAFAIANPQLKQTTPLTNGNQVNGHAHNLIVPAFVLHTKGAFYVPVTLDYHALLPYLGAHDLFGAMPDVVLHPVAINVNFQQPAKKFEAPVQL